MSCLARCARALAQARPGDQAKPTQARLSSCRVEIGLCQTRVGFRMAQQTWPTWTYIAPSRLHRSASPVWASFLLSHGAPAGRSVHKTGAVFAPGADRSLVFLFRKEKARGSRPLWPKSPMAGRSTRDRPAAADPTTATAPPTPLPSAPVAIYCRTEGRVAWRTGVW